VVTTPSLCSSGQAFRVPGIKQEAVGSGPDHLGCGAHVGRDDRQPGAHRFQQRVRHPFDVRRKDEYVGCPVVLRQIVGPTTHDHMIILFDGILGDILARRTDDHQFGPVASRQFCPGIQQVAQTLLPGKSPGEKNEDRVER
jgi:hypothetical protein